MAVTSRSTSKLSLAVDSSWLCPLFTVALLINGSALYAITAGQIDDFEDGTTQGWSEGRRSPNLPENVGTGGAPGAFVQNVSSGRSSAGSRWVMFNTDQWSGSFIDAGVTGIEMHIKNFSSDVDPVHMRIAIEGPGRTRFGSTTAVEVPADDQWHSVTFGLSVDELSSIAGNRSLEDVLASVGTVRVLAARAGPEWIGDLIPAVIGVDNILALGPVDATPELLAGDADQDLDFDQLDLVAVQIASKYLTGQTATWGEGDWNGAPGGMQGQPPAGDGMFNQLDIVAAQIAGVYLTGPYAAVKAGGVSGDLQTSVIYDPGTGEFAVDAPAGSELTSINVDSTAGIFTGAAAQNLGGSFDNDSDTNIFKATFGGSFGSLSFGNVAQAGLDPSFLLNDLSVVGSLAGGGALGEVDLIYVPEPTSCVLLLLGVLATLAFRRGQTRARCNVSGIL